MYYEIFIDVFFAINLVMDYLLLRLVNRLLRCSATRRRSVAGALWGALSLSLLISVTLPGKRYLNTILVHVVINTIMVKFGCKIKDWCKLLQGLLLLYLSSFLIGGVLTVLERRNPKDSLLTFFLLAATSYLVITAAILIYTRLKGRGTNFYEVVLYAGGNCRKVKGFYDTGNGLYDPLSGKPVSIVKEREIKELLGEENVTSYRPHYIPFRSLGCPSGVIPAVTLDALEVEEGKACCKVRRPVVALAKEEFCIVGGCQMILNPDVVDN